jgi:hypothetical protein
MAKTKTSVIHFQGWNGKDKTVGINRKYLIGRINRLEKQKTGDADIAELVRRRDRLHYDEAAVAEFESGEGKIASRIYRWNEHDWLRRAYAAWEDFLYYQNSVHRWDRVDALKDVEDRKKLKPNTTWRLAPTLFRSTHPDWYLQNLLDHYDRHSIGGEEYRQNRRDVTGTVTWHGPGPADARAIGPQELHLWTPVPRRLPVGLRDKADLQKVTRRIQRSYPLELDYEAIEQERTRIENKPLRPARDGDILEYDTHAARRVIERAKYWTEDSPRTERPSTSNMRCVSPDQYEERIRQIRTAQGLFIAAKESSYDTWTANVPPVPGSEDGSDDPANGGKPGEKRRNQGNLIPPESAVADVESDGSDYEAWDLFKPTTPKPTSAPTEPGPEIDNQSTEKKATEKGKAKGKGKKAAGKGKAKGKGQKTKKPAAAEVDPEEQERTARNNRAEARNKMKASEAADFDYAYENFEFSKVERPLRSYERLWPPHFVFEATDGRREWHVGMKVLDSSPPTSPPRAPMPNDAQLESVPEGLEDADLPNPAYTRCPHLTANCRAWWGHSPADCWQANLESLGRPKKKQKTNHPGSEDDMDEEQDTLGDEASEDGDTEIKPVPPELLPIARSGRETYRHRLRDHYGRLHKGEGENWPAFGIRVPYDPMTVLEDMGHHKAAKETGEEADVMVVVSMAVPLISKSQRGWGWDIKEPPEMPPGGYGGGGVDGNGDDSDDEDSDDDGDLFRKSYLEGSVTAGADSAAGDQADPANDPIATQPTDAPTEEESDGHDDLYDD